MFKELQRRCIAIKYIILGNAVIFNTRMEVDGTLTINGKNYVDLFIENNEFYISSIEDRIYFGLTNVSTVVVE